MKGRERKQITFKGRREVRQSDGRKQVPTGRLVVKLPPVVPLTNVEHDTDGRLQELEKESSVDIPLSDTREGK